MTTPWSLGAQTPSEWLHVLLGLVALAALGTGLANRILPGHRLRFWLAPVAACSALPLAQIILDAFLGTPVRESTTWLLVGSLSIWAWSPDLRRMLADDFRWRKPALPERRKALCIAGIAVVLLAVAGVQALSHIPGEPTAGPHTAYIDLPARWLQGLQGDDHPYPIHVDEHIHIAQTLQLSRDEALALKDPYTGQPRDTGLFSISGLRSERGFELLTLQVSHLTGLSLAAIYRFTPALWAGVIAGTLWASLRPHPGALASAATVAAMPSTARLLGPGFLIPSTFALPWVPATLMLMFQGRGGGRFGGLLLLITGAFFMHIVLGVVSMLAALAAIVAMDGTRRGKLALVATTLLPLVWILPILWVDAVAAVSGEHELPFATWTFISLGPGLLALVAGGCAALLFPNVPKQHKAWAMLLAILLASMVWSVINDHRNDATYSRIIFSAYLAAGALAGLALTHVCHWLAAKWRHPERRGAMMLVAMLVIMSWPVAANLNMPMYRVWTEDAWEQHAPLAATLEPGDVFLSDPWLAPLYSAYSEGEPFAVLYPGKPPVNAGAWTTYVAAEGNVTWLAQNDIKAVVEFDSSSATWTPARLRIAAQD